MYLRELLRFVFVYRLAYLLRCLVSFSFFVELPQIWRLLAVAWFRLAQGAGCLAGWLAGWLAWDLLITSIYVCFD